MKKLFYIILTPFILLAFAGCKKPFSELNINENKPTTVPASLLFNGIINTMYDGPYGSGERYGQYYLCNQNAVSNNLANCWMYQFQMKYTIRNPTRHAKVIGGKAAMGFPFKKTA